MFNFATIIFISLYFWIVQPKYLYVLHGLSGDGKSSVVNMMNMGEAIAKEGATFEAETFGVTLYNTSFDDIELIDGPGLAEVGNDFRSDEDIRTLIQATLISSSNNEITGLILVFDPTNTRLHIQKVIESSLLMFNSNILKHSLFLFNKIDQLVPERQNTLIKYVKSKLIQIYTNYNIDSNIIDDRIILLDTKGSLNKYTNILYNAIIKCGENTFSVLTDNDINKLIQPYFDIELKNESNYNTKIDTITHSEIRYTIEKQKKIVSYTEQCNPRRVCTRKVKLGFGTKCLRRKTIYDTCARTRTDDVDVSVPYTHEWTENKTRKILKNTREYLWEKAKNKMIQDMRNKVYQNCKA